MKWSNTISIINVCFPLLISHSTYLLPVLYTKSLKLCCLWTFVVHILCFFISYISEDRSLCLLINFTQHDTFWFHSYSGKIYDFCFKSWDYVYVPVCLFTCSWSLGLFPDFDYYKYCCDEYRNTDVLKSVLDPWVECHEVKLLGHREPQVLVSEKCLYWFPKRLY